MAMLRERAPLSGEVSWESIGRTTALRVFVAVPVVADGRVLGAVLVSRTPRNIVQTLYSKRHALMALAVVLVASVAALAWFAGYTVVRPTRQLCGDGAAGGARRECGRDGARSARPMTREARSLSRPRAGPGGPRMNHLRGVTGRLAGRIDPLGVLMTVAALVVFVAHGFHGSLYRDAAIYAYAGQQVADGVPPYVGIMNRAGPLAHLVPGLGVLGAQLVGIDELLGMRILMMVLSIAVVWVTYLCGRDLFGSRLAGTVSATAMLTFQGFVTYATGGPREKTIMMLFLVMGVWAVSKRRWAWAGVCVAFATLAWQPAFFPTTAAALVGIAALRSVRPIGRALISFAVGGLVPTAICVLGFWMAGALRDFVDGFVLANARYTRQPGLIEWADTGFSQLENGFGWSLWVAITGLVMSLVIGAARAPGAFRDRAPNLAAVTANGAAALAAFLWSLRAFNGWPDAMVLLPMAALGIGAIAQLVLDHTPRRWGTDARDRGQRPAPDRRAHRVRGHARRQARASATGRRPDPRQRTRRSHDHVLRGGPATGADRTDQPVPAPELPRRARRVRRRHLPGGLAGFADFVAQERPTYLTFDNEESYPFLADVLDRDYVRVGTTSGWTWFVSRDVGPEVIQDLRDTKVLVNETGRASASDR